MFACQVNFYLNNSSSASHILQMLFYSWMLVFQWAPQHEGISCEKFKEWEQLNSPEYQNSRLEQLLSRNKIGETQTLAEGSWCKVSNWSFSQVVMFSLPLSDCPKCKFRFFLARGGCLHFRCTQCQHEFCGGCSQPFKQGSVS